jgi:hypothetical protein
MCGDTQQESDSTFIFICAFFIQLVGVFEMVTPHRVGTGAALQVLQIASFCLDNNYHRLFFSFHCCFC